jgi:26S proteasome non-ATPase regulatory subunit 9
VRQGGREQLFTRCPHRLLTAASPPAARHRQTGVTSLSAGPPAAPPTPPPAAAPTAALAAAAGAAAHQHDDKRPRLGDAAGQSVLPPQQPPLRPFAVVDEVSEGSPAAAAGIQLWDQLCRCVFVCAIGGVAAIARM